MVIGWLLLNVLLGLLYYYIVTFCYIIIAYIELHNLIFHDIIIRLLDNIVSVVAWRITLYHYMIISLHYVILCCTISYNIMLLYSYVILHYIIPFYIIILSHYVSLLYYKALFTRQIFLHVKIRRVSAAEICKDFIFFCGGFHRVSGCGLALFNRANPHPMC